jgi:hypothetical protein
MNVPPAFLYHIALEYTIIISGPLQGASVGNSAFGLIIFFGGIEHVG